MHCIELKKFLDKNFASGSIVSPKYYSIDEEKNKKIFDELLKKRNEGLDVKIIIDNNRVNKEKPSFTLEDHFEVYRVDVMSERYKNIMHRKFCVIDLEVAMHGTFNWTNAANYNKEHWDVDHNRETAKTFAEEFVKMRRDAELSMLWLDF